VVDSVPGPARAHEARAIAKGRAASKAAAALRTRSSRYIGPTTCRPIGAITRRLLLDSKKQTPSGLACQMSMRKRVRRRRAQKRPNLGPGVWSPACSGWQGRRSRHRRAGSVSIRGDAVHAYAPQAAGAARASSADRSRTTSPAPCCSSPPRSSAPARAGILSSMAAGSETGPSGVVGASRAFRPAFPFTRLATIRRSARAHRSKATAMAHRAARLPCRSEERCRRLPSQTG